MAAAPYVLHMLTPLKHVSPFDVNMAADAGNAFGLQPGKGGGDFGAGETTALDGGEVVAHHPLQFPHGATEGIGIAFRKRRQRRHDHQPAQVPGFLCRKGRQCLECLGFCAAVQPLAVAVQDQQNPPVIRKWQACDDGRGLLPGAAAAVQDDAAIFERADSDS